jgi:transposase
VPPLRLVVTEHRLVRKQCPECGQPNIGAFPAEVPPGASYGPGVQSVLAYLNQEHLLPVKGIGKIKGLWELPWNWLKNRFLVRLTY